MKDSLLSMALCEWCLVAVGVSWWLSVALGGSRWLSVALSVSRWPLVSVKGCRWLSVTFGFGGVWRLPSVSVWWHSVVGDGVTFCG